MVSNKHVYAFSLSLAVFLPGCTFVDWLHDTFGSKKAPTVTRKDVEENGGYYVEGDKTAVLATMDGNPIVTEAVLNAELQKAIDADPQIKMMLACIPEKQLKRQLLDSLVSKVIMDKALTEQGIKESKEYQADFQQILGQVKDMLNAKYFTKSFEKVSVPESEIRAAYEKNKDAMLMVSQGGTKAMGVMFDTQEAAQEFVPKAQAAKGDLKKAAREAQIPEEKVRDYNLVNTQSVGVEPEIREKILSITAFPSVDTISAGDKVWVIAATAKEEAQYRPYEQVKEALEKQLMEAKTVELFEKELKKYKDSYNVSVDEQFFASGQEDAGESAQALMEALTSAAQGGEPEVDLVD